MEGISSHGNNAWIFYTSCILLSVIILSLASFKEKRMSEIKLINREIIAYDSQLREMNEMEIEGVNIW